MKKGKKMIKNKIIKVQDVSITVASEDLDDYICITDMAAAKGGDSRAADVVKNWMRNRLTLEFLGTWEQIYNPDFKVVEFDHFKSEADILNVVLFGFTAKAWRECNPELAKKNNVRDFATINELTVLSNMETHNAQMIGQGKSRQERFAILKEIAAYQLKILNEADQVKTQIGSQE